jgi:hypothetical protein
MTPRLLSLLAGFKPIPLADLERHCELQVRVDRKYIVDQDMLERVVSVLLDEYVALEVRGQRLQGYDSIYFDTPSLMIYRQHLQGRRKRFKCRTRLYEDTGACFFDLKMKGHRGETIKRRLPLSPRDHGTLTPPARVFLERELMAEYGRPAPTELAPVLRTSFTRLTLAHARHEERLTCDFGVALGADGGEERYRMRREGILLETKSTTGHGLLDRVLVGLGARPLATSCSKYCLGIAMTHADLPASPYRPVLRRHFDPAAVLGLGLAGNQPALAVDA